MKSKLPSEWVEPKHCKLYTPHSSNLHSWCGVGYSELKEGTGVYCHSFEDNTKVGIQLFLSEDKVKEADVYSF